MTEIRLGIDVGGTFTDCVVLNKGQLFLDKIFTNPKSPADAVLEIIARQKIPGSVRIELAHGTTVATNAILERKTARVALITTSGFKHILHIGRQQRASLYNPRLMKAEPLVQEDHCLEIKERMDHQGQVVTPVTDQDLKKLLNKVKKIKPEAIAISLLYSFRNSLHEEQLARTLSAHIPCPLSLSSRVSPEIREFERTSTTAIDAAIKPIVSHYLTKITSNLAGLRVEPFHVMQSNGGVNLPEAVMKQPVNLVLSGPAGGVSACRSLAELTGEPNLIGLDMGGTSTDVSIIVDGRITTVEAGKIGGLPMQLPMIDIETIGAGGGSIAWIDQGGLLKVGPHSAGALPGPICYQKGGTDLTVSDANLLLGYLPADHFLLNLNMRYRGQNYV
ncbi:hydantoinase/oxoprolinase family protein, partial [candidate division CSSED10-310 bacterium]